MSEERARERLAVTAELAENIVQALYDEVGAGGTHQILVSRVNQILLNIPVGEGDDESLRQELIETQQELDEACRFIRGINSSFYVYLRDHGMLR